MVLLCSYFLFFQVARLVRRVFLFLLEQPTAALEFGDRVVVVIDMESGQRFIIRCEAAIPLPALVHVLS